MDAKRRLAVGTMTGTSLDGLDVAAVELAGRGLGMRATAVAHRSFPLALSARLREACEGKAATAGEFAGLARDFGLAHVAAIRATVGDGRPDLIAIHGQTVFHRPPVSWQLVNPFPVAEAFGCPVASDLRGADLAAGGQGAPITPLSDWVLFRGPVPRAIVNLGGFCNVTVLPEASRPDALAAIGGFDACACNQVLDAAARAVLGKPFDADGATAAAGRADPDATASLRERLDRQRAERRSLGTGDEAAAWVAGHASRLAPADLLASAVAAVGGSIGAAVGEGLARLGRDAACEVLLAGGGARNRALVATIASTSGFAARTTADLGIPIEAREAMGMAILGALALDGVATTLPQVTGRGASGVADALWCLPRSSVGRFA
jgi:1,6-anhydro-N-acetylmuramate kinase